MVVLFPAPFSPINPTIYPLGTTRLILSREKVLYFLLNPFTSMAFYIVIPPQHIKYLKFELAHFE